MVTSVNELPAVDPDSGCLNVVVDTPKGSRNKYKFDEQHGQWRLSKVLPQGLFFPYDFGFLPSTRGEDGDPVDVLLLMDEDVYRRAGDAHGDTTADPTVEKLHEWRKQAKYLRYQREVLRPLWPERMEELANEADRMGELLGDDHDLAALRQMLTDDPGRFGDEGDREVLLALIDRRRAELEQEAMLLGQRFFQDNPRDFARRLKGYWKTWRAQAETEQTDESPIARV